MQLNKTWTEFKALVDAGALFVEHVIGSDYELFAQDGELFYDCVITYSTEKTDYTTNYQSKKASFLNPIDVDGKKFTRAESRPLNKTTYFTMVGDSETVIRAGQKTIYDFANTDNDVTSPPTGFKRKIIDLTFLNALNIKEGALYFKNMEWGSYIDLSVVAKAPILHPSVDVVVEHFVANHFMFGTNNLGDELNTEAASAEIPAGFTFRLTVTVPDTTWTTGEEPGGYVSFEMYTGSTIAIL